MNYRSASYTILIVLSILAALVLGACDSVWGTGSPTPTAEPTLANASSVHVSTIAPQPEIHLNPEHGAGGTVVEVVGKGFPARNQVEIRLGGLTSGATQEAYAVTRSNQFGEVSVYFTMPSWWPNGDPIVQPQILVLASTADVVKKATAVFNYESSLSTPPSGPTTPAP